LPLKVFVKDEETLSPFTGFKQKGIWYYKARGTDTRVNVNAKKLNSKFETLLKHFEFRKEHREKLKLAIREKLRTRLSLVLAESVQLKKRISEFKNQMESIEEKFVLGKLSEDLYQKYMEKYNGEIKDLEAELSKSAFESSNLEKAVEKGLAIADNLSQQWLSADFDRKKKLQYLIFPEGIRYCKKNDTVQTERVNELFALIAPQARLLKENEKGNSEKNCLESHEVIRIGFKPMTYCLEGSCSIQLSYRTIERREDNALQLFQNPIRPKSIPFKK
jgi:site-specific DNA recombinase